MDELLKKGQIMTNDKVPMERQDIPPLPSVVGFIEEIHGEQGVPCPDYVPTKFELGLLARHWAEVKVEIDDSVLTYQEIGSYDMRMQFYSSKRLHRIAQQIGDARIDEIIEDAVKKYPPFVPPDQLERDFDASTTPDVADTYEA